MRWMAGLAAGCTMFAASPAFATQWIGYFEYGSADMSPAGYSAARSAAAYVRMAGEKPVRVLITAHMDAAEADEFSDELGLRRAQSMATELVSLGVDPALIELHSRGATQRARPTADHVREPLNRRALIEVIF
ncbi:hypothetical protein ASG17_10700 [Brevundimonas sp. Leaf363]|uniref:OmpA family protein n=1 Tax=Brevundimonas sp. Leaf363 TaxID=1736353 RepID=UPI0006F79D18|nr:OmpA family protein [Brevundimonas sp. Leaf363]KQS56450.1 hypothetical protein ASG17_10700 [Brevundimonas sp. Leaf363]